MVKPQLIEYIQQQYEQGFSPDAIADALLNQGWEPDEVQEALESFEFSDGSPQSSPIEEMVLSFYNKIPADKKPIFFLVGVSVLLIFFGLLYFLSQSYIGSSFNGTSDTATTSPQTREQPISIGSGTTSPQVLDDIANLDAVETGAQPQSAEDIQKAEALAFGISVLEIIRTDDFDALYDLTRDETKANISRERFTESRKSRYVEPGFEKYWEIKHVYEWEVQNMYDTKGDVAIEFLLWYITPQGDLVEKGGPNNYRITVGKRAGQWTYIETQHGALFDETVNSIAVAPVGLPSSVSAVSPEPVIAINTPDETAREFGERVLNLINTSQFDKLYDMSSDEVQSIGREKFMQPFGYEHNYSELSLSWEFQSETEQGNEAILEYRLSVTHFEGSPEEFTDEGLYYLFLETNGSQWFITGES